MLYRLSYSRPLFTNQVYRPQRDGEEAAGVTEVEAGLRRAGRRLL